MTSQNEGTGSADPRTVRRAAMASLVGTAVEWYDYFLFGAASALVFGRLFFPDADPIVGTISSFAVFGVGFFARPLGGIVFGHLGDRVGRKSALIATLLIMGLSTCAIGLLPTYSQVGLLAPVLLTVLRLLQGFGVGGEWGGAALVAVEYAPSGRRGRFGSFPQMGNAIGVSLATGVLGLFTLLPDEQFDTWGWRVPFLLSVVLVGVAYFIRSRLAETPDFAKVKRERAVARSPLAETLRDQRRPLLLVAGMRFGENVLGFMIMTFMLNYATDHAGVADSLILAATTTASLIAIGTFFLFGALSDRVGRKPVYLFGAVFSTCCGFPMFWLVDTAHPVLVFIGVVLPYAIGIGAQYGVQPAFFAELFSTRVRYTGVSLGSQIASVFAGGLAPTIAAALLGWAAGSPWPIALYIMASSAVSVVAVLLTSETSPAAGAASAPAAPPAAKDTAPEQT